MLTTLLVLALANTLSPDQIAAAIAEGVKLKDKPWTIGLRWPDWPGGFAIAVYGPQARISVAAAMAAAKYQTFGPEQVTDDMTAPVLTVHATPRHPEPIGVTGWNVTPLATHVVLRAKGGIVVQPTKVELVPTGWSNMAGGQVAGRGVIAMFDLASLPDGEVDVVIVTMGEERYRTIKAKDRAKIK